MISCSDSQIRDSTTGNCRPKTAQELCEEQGKTLTDQNECLTQNEIKQKTCESKNANLDTATGKCKCPPEHKIKSNKCVPLTKEDKCKAKGNPWVWDGRRCKCPNAYILDGRKCRSKTEKEKCEETPGKEWKSGKCQDTAQTECKKRGEAWKWNERACICPTPNIVDGTNCRPKTEKEKCEETPGKEWKEGKCQDTDQTECKKRGEPWKWNGRECKCPSPNVTDGRKCREKTEKEKCEDQGKTLTDKNECLSQNEIKQKDCESKNANLDIATGKCKCPAGHKVKDNKCVLLTEEDKCNERSGKKWLNGECIDCPEWKQHEAFNSNGKVKESFCMSYASNVKECKKALEKLQRLAKQLEKYKDRIEKEEERILGLDDSKREKTEAGGLCFDCLKRVMQASKPSTEEIFGNLGNILLGAGQSALGYFLGREAQMDANMLRVSQGYPAENGYYAVNGISAGYPYIANGIYGLTRNNTPVGGWACTPTVNPYGHTHSHPGYGYGYKVPYY
ncbi:MAG: hypothetical protein GDA46_01080 [Bdellovibrionales bacterium]|nr:hypothetical protein [Bdellovibrionales bacterium]